MRVKYTSNIAFCTFAIQNLQSDEVNYACDYICALTLRRIEKSATACDQLICPISRCIRGDPRAARSVSPDVSFIAASQRWNAPEGALSRPAAHLVSYPVPPSPKVLALESLPFSHCKRILCRFSNILVCLPFHRKLADVVELDSVRYSPCGLAP